MYGYYRQQRPKPPFPQQAYCRYPQPDPCWCYDGPPGPTGPSGPGCELKNIIDGNTKGSVRGIHTHNDYTMGENAFAIGFDTVASGNASFAQGIRAAASGGASHAEGYDTVSNSLASHAEGNAATATGEAAHAEGGSHASGFYAHAEGLSAKAEGETSHAQGKSTIASGDNAHAQGHETTASGENAHSEGRLTTASAFAAHAQGSETEASGFAAHAEGGGCVAEGSFSHAEGIDTKSTAIGSHAQGISTIASGYYSHAEGTATSTNSYFGAHIMGSYGSADTAYSWFLANGSGPQNTGLAAKILRDGNAYIDVAWNAGGADYAEMYETETGKALEPGCFVTFAGTGKKVRLAQSYDPFILGITSAMPGFVAGSGALRWKKKYLTDEWGRILYEDVALPEVIDKKGNVLIPARVESRPMLNPAFDPEKEYLPREHRPEWVKVGLLGMMLVQDDGTLTSGGYCRPGVNGVATAAHDGWRVLERTGEKQALIFYR